MAVARSHPESPSATICVEMVKRLPCDVEGIPASALAPPLTEGRWPNRRYLENVMHHLVQTQITRQERYLPFLATTGNIAPFIGLLGTVIGVINAFREIGIQGTASIVAVAPGVAEALVATAAGLFAAIPAVVAYNYFLMKVRQTTFRIEAFCLELLEALEGWMAQEQEKEVHVVR
ncbi:MAG: hypothetical protein D6704_00845 [Nitrospirae bacterium]|nr:MAG: hypothetical protein D6704_00845 [Nitrospirota bacterium]